MFMCVITLLLATSFANESIQSRCHHIIMQGDVRWPSERKFFKITFIGIHSNEIISYFRLLRRALRRSHPYSSHISFKT